MPPYGGDYDRGLGRHPSPGMWRRSPERAREGRGRYDEALYHRYARQAAGRSLRHQHAGGWMRGYDREHAAHRGSPGVYGASMYGGGRYGGDYMGAWVPGGWSAEHGREHTRLRRPRRYGREFIRSRNARPYWDPAPTS